MCATVLVCESLVVLFALLVAKDLADVPTATVLWLGGGTAAACLVLTGLLRHRWAYVLGSLLQVVLVLAGLLVPAMFFLGALFAALWVTALVLARRIEDVQGSRAAP